MAAMAIVVAICVAACAPQLTWIAAPEQLAAEVRGTPTRCRERGRHFRPTRDALLGSPPSELFRWARRVFPDHFRVGRRGRIGLVPNGSPDAALQAVARFGRVVFMSVQSHAPSASAAAPLSRRGVEHFLLSATSCSSYRLCEARLDLGEARYRGYTTCRGVRVPVRVVTARTGRSVVAVATWLPLFEGDADPGEERP